MSKGVLNALLGSKVFFFTRTQADPERLVRKRRLEDAEEVLALQDHTSCFERSDSRLIFYIAGYVARKCVKTQYCIACTTICMRDRASAHWTIRLPSRSTLIEEDFCMKQTHYPGLLANFKPSSRIVSARELFMRKPSVTSWPVH